MLNNNSTGVIGSNVDLSQDDELLEFINVYETLVSKYYEKIDRKGMLEAAEEGMLDFLGDKYTTYLEDSEYQEIMEELSGTYDGIGISVENNVVVGVTESSPANSAGILTNDIILKINNTSVEGMSGNDISELIKNSNIKEIKLEINRNGQILNFTLEKASLINPVINYEKVAGTNIGYLSIENFSKNLSAQVSNALKKLENEGITSLIIDVRDNVGGYLSAAEETASLFLEEGKNIYSLETSTNTYKYNDETKEKRDYPVVVLININSASASEILAAALKESYGATLVGTKSYGKGKVQQILGDSVKYTFAKWLTPSGNYIDNVGLVPDYNIACTDCSIIDTQLSKAIELLQ